MGDGEASDGVRVGVLSLHISKETKAICNAIEALGHEAAWMRTENTTLDITDGSVTITPEVDIVANRLLLSNTAQPCEDLGLAITFADVWPMLNHPSAVLRAVHKVATATSLTQSGLTVPNAFLALDSATLNSNRPSFGESAVYKTAIGTHGGGTWRVGPDDHVNATVGNRRAFLQDMIETGEGPTRDLRVYVVGDKSVGSMYRYASGEDWRTNVALGGDVEDATEQISDEVREMAVQATQHLKLDYAGVDLVEGTDGWYILEVNPTAGFRGFFKATGVSPAPYIAQLAIEQGGGTVDTEKVRELATTFDDSRPSCTPRRQPSQQFKQVSPIGLTEEVFVSGTSGTESVVAKSDTGADRTSIDTSLAAAIGAGPIKRVTRVKSGSSKRSRTRPVVDVVVGVGGNRHTVTASVEDRNHMQYQVLLGRDILKHYHVDVTRNADGPTDDDEGILEE